MLFCTFLCHPWTTTTWNSQVLSLLENRNSKAINSTIPVWTLAQSPLFSSNRNSLHLNNWATWQLLQKSLRGCEAYLSIACSAGVFIGRARMVLIAKAPCWNSRREEEMGRVKGRGRGRGERRENLQLIDRHQSTPPSRTNQELRLPAYGVSQKNNVIGQAYFFLPLPLPPLLFLPSHLPSGLILLLSPIFLCHRIKDGGFIVAIRLTSPPKIRLHCRLIFQQQFHGRFPCQIVRSLLQV